MSFLQKSVLGACALAVMGCVSAPAQRPADTAPATKPAASVPGATTTQQLLGSYASEGYDKRAQGYDWVGVTVAPADQKQLRIAVRSRADKKKPTCTFDAVVQPLSPTVYQASVEGKNILFTFARDTVTISTKSDADRGVLNYYCSGGGSLADTYRKINGELDQRQVDPRVFQKNLNSWNQVGFNVSATGAGSTQQLTIQPYGFKVDNSKITMPVDGQVVGAELGDLNVDGYPELLVYTQSAGSGSYGNVIAYSSNRNKSLSQVPFPNIADHAKAGKGYMGHDEFAVVENTFVQRFPVYAPQDTNSRPSTGIMRQIQYKMRDGEASRQFVIDRIVEYPMD